MMYSTLFLFAAITDHTHTRETPWAKYAWLNRILAISVGRRMPGQVRYAVYAIL